MNVNLRRGKIEDAQTCGAICYEAFKKISDHHNFPNDLPNADSGIGLVSMLLDHPHVYSVVAEADGRVVGSNFLWETGAIAGIGPITIDPSSQNSSIGKGLMVDVINYANERGFAGIRLCQAAYHNRSLSLYTKLGFDTREPLSVIQGKPLNLTIAGRNVRAADENDVTACNELCMKIHGHERSNELTDAIQQGTANVVESEGRITGYTTGVGFFGYSVGESNEDLKALIAASPEFSGPGFLLPTRNSELLRWCLFNGLQIAMPMTLMSIGLYNEPRGAFLASVIF